MNQIIFSFGSVIKIFKIAFWLCEYDEAINLEEEKRNSQKMNRMKFNSATLY